MALDEQQAIEKAKELQASARAEREVLDDIRRYWTGSQQLPRVIPKSAPIEVRRMARMSRINVIAIVVESLSQSLFVEGFRGKGEDDNTAVWSIWQANRLDARQTGIHRAALAYGTSYAVVVADDDGPLIRGVSPRRLHAVYEPDAPDWPTFALERRSSRQWRLYDEGLIHYIAEGRGDRLEHVDMRRHGSEIVPIVRFREIEDLDLEDEPEVDDTDPLEIATDHATGNTYSRTSRARASGLAIGQVSPLMTLQDQVDVVTFNLMVAMHFAAFRQRYILGWVGSDEKETLSATASKLWTFDDPEVKVGELGETSLEGYIKAREASLRHAASLSQTPAHELIGELVNLSAEALAAAEAGRDRKVADRETMFGESHEQALRLAGTLARVDVPVDAQMIWRDTSARSFAATVDGLGKLATMLGVPPQELWERIPGVSQQDVERWKAQATTGDAFANLADLLRRQAPVAPTAG
jgi:hypothetical protein